MKTEIEQKVTERTEMTARFQVSRWSATRRKIHALGVRKCARFPKKEYFNVAASVARLNDAYAGMRQWVISGGRKMPTAKRIR